ncbi:MULTISPECIES: hypothetical protein [unclassified Spirosoma]|uniref:hypothetical protein n=1 Tax=unclassified Spirosoma TaxID=2621999 RepID=UPI0009691321|nr:MULTISPECIES: hypothetical protein [unclassified Spirosoma]MBN8820709.1 hypothetical protein [Spirosoma sp.]OJW76381.1 MAG: hypothetical protein BGO59_22945 [Spirosoma sp. 48-14]
MKTIHFSIDLRSFFLGALTLTGVLLLTNFKPSGHSPSERALNENRRYQAATGEQGSIILDTQTGQYILVYGPGKGLRTKFNFDELEPKAK